jgi:hypothetical protein
MRRLLQQTLIVLAIAFLVPAQATAVELDSFIAEVNVSANLDMGSFRADLNATFGVSSHDIDELFVIFDSPADIYISLRICDIAGVSIERVAAEYRKGKGQGWGVMAKNLGIKPGSAEFHALKNGQYNDDAHGRSSSKPGKGNSGNKKKGDK